MSALAVLEEIHRVDPDTDRLSLSGLELDRIDAAVLVFLQEKFPSMRHLSLRDNALTRLPSEFGSCLPKLLALDVRDNPVASIPELSEALATCPALQSLWVTLHNATDEKVLRVMLPRLKMLNGISVGDGERSHRPSPLSLELPPSPTSGSSCCDDDSLSPGHRWIDTPPSTAGNSVVRPVRSPQEKRELRIKLAAASTAMQSKKKATTPTNTTKAKAKLSSPKDLHSVRPTELPATISDDKTDWRKLLKQTTAARDRQKEAALETHVEDTELSGPTTESSSAKPVTTRSFIAELKGIVRGFQKPLKQDTTADDHKLLEQLERKIDLLALQLNDLEKKPDDGDQSDAGHVATAALTARWRLVEAGAQYATHRVARLDKAAGAGLQRLVQTQTQVVEALLRHVNDAIYAQQKWQTASASQQQVAEQQKQQMKLLLDVAETLEKDLEALQAKYDQERIQREQAQKATQSLESECNDLKLRLLQQKPSETAKEDTASQPGPQRRIRKRQEKPNTVNGTEGSPPKLRTEQHATDVPIPAARPPSPTKPVPVVRNLTLKQLVDLIHCILTSKSKYDARMHTIGAPPETVEQHMYTYLNQRFGLQPLIVEYASAIWKGCQMHTRQDNDVAMFHTLLRNQVDEDFVGIKKKLQQAVRELLRAYFHAKHPLKSEPVIQKLVDAKLHGGLIYEEEWTELLLYLYDPSDSSILMRLTKRKADTYRDQQKQQEQTVQRPTQAAPCLPFAVFEKLLFDYQLQGRLKLLENFRTQFAALDDERVGVLTRNTFRELVTQVSQRKKSDGEFQKMLERLDPFNHDGVTFSDAVRCLLPDIRQQSVNRRKDADVKEKPPARTATGKR